MSFLVIRELVSLIYFCACVWTELGDTVTLSTQWQAGQLSRIQYPTEMNESREWTNRYRKRGYWTNRHRKGGDWTDSLRHRKEGDWIDRYRKEGD